jgi:hypothetical protein
MPKMRFGAGARRPSTPGRVRRRHVRGRRALTESVISSHPLLTDNGRVGAAKSAMGMNRFGFFHFEIR